MFATDGDAAGPMFTDFLYVCSFAKEYIRARWGWYIVKVHCKLILQRYIFLSFMLENM